MTARDARRRAADLAGSAPRSGAVSTARATVMPASGEWWPQLHGPNFYAARLATVLAGWRDRLAHPGRDEADHAEMLESVARSLRAGQSLAAALDEASLTQAGTRPADDLRRALGLLDVGMGIADVVDEWVESRPGPARVLAGAALGLGAQLGGAQSRSLDGAAAGLRDRAELIREVRALTSQARTSAAVMVLAPAGFAIYSWTADDRVSRVMFATPAGWACLAVGLALDGLGAVWMAKLVGQVT